MDKSPVPTGQILEKARVLQIVQNAGAEHQGTVTPKVMVQDKVLPFKVVLF